MSDSTPVNSQITDAVTQTNVKVLAESPAMAMGNLYQTIAYSSGLALANSVQAQNHQNITSQAATTKSVMQIYSYNNTSIK